MIIVVLTVNDGKYWNFCDEYILQYNTGPLVLKYNTRKYDFPYEYAFRNGDILECLEDTKLQ